MWRGFQPGCASYADRMTSAPYAALDAARSPVFSQDGGTVFYLRGLLPQVWAMDLASHVSRPLTAHNEPVAGFRRAPGDDRLVYGIDAGGDERQQLWLWDGAARPLTDASDTIHTLGAWFPDGTRFAFATNDRDPACFDIQVLEVATGLRTRLHEGRGEMSVSGWDRAGTRLLATALHATGDDRPLVVGEGPLPRPGPARYAQLRWTNAGIMGLTDQGREYTALCLLDGTPVYAPECDVDAWALSPDGTQLATLENVGGCSLLKVGSSLSPRERVGVRVNPSDDLSVSEPSPRPSPGGRGSCVMQDIAWSPDGRRLVMSLSTPTEPPGLWLWEDGDLRPLWRPDCPVPTVPFAPVGWTSFDDQRIPGWFARPSSAPPAAGHPAVVWVHGGPAWQERPAFRADMQALLAQGIAVLMPNVRGSTGYGRAYRTAADLDRRLDAVQDLAHGARWLAAQPGIDPARIAVMGESYGGYMVLAAITEHPALWRCAIDLYGIADFGTLLERTGPWRRAHRATEYGDPIRHRSLFDRISPLRHVDRIQAPLLVLHGTRDPRVPIHESEQLVAAMGAAAKPVAYEVFDYAGHGFVRPADKARAWNAVETFLRRTL